MDFKEVDQALEELEGRIERLKALYEQYFMGIEKLEPLVPRKDVDRRIQILRREQVRNTAQRFKFQTLVQRYNSFQQYWARVAREIENGTYHRDVARAAARFGAKDALTIFGKKQAEKYQRLVANQEARKARRQTTHTIDEEMLADDDLMFVDDEVEATDVEAVDMDDDESRPTPVVPAATRRASVPPPPPPVIPPLPPPPRASSLGAPVVPPPLPPGARLPGPVPVPVVNMKEEDVAEEIDLQDDEILEFVEDKPARARKAIRPETMFPIMMRRPEQSSKVSEPIAPEPAQRSPSVAPSPETGKKRVAALAAQVKQRGGGATMPQGNRPLDLELDLGQGAATKASPTLDLDFDRDPKPQDKPPAKAEKPLDLDLDQGARATVALKVERSEPALARAENESLTGRTEREDVRAPAIQSPEIREAPAPESTRAPAELSAEELRAAAARVAAAARERLAAVREERAAAAREEREAAAREERATAAREERAAAAREERATAAREASGGAGSLSDTRIRQIYGEYVDAKRSVKESTAGVTYDTLAKQLRQQAEKLEASHPGRKVDYSVVMKNGKPTLKPILR